MMFEQKGGIDLAREWATSSRWAGIERPYSVADVERLRGSLHVEHTLARIGAFKFWHTLHGGAFIRALGALTGNQALQQVQAGLNAIYVSGWQVAADANNACAMYPDLSLYPSDSVPRLVRRINNAFRRADMIQHMGGGTRVDWFKPIVADAEAGFGGVLNSFEIMQAMIEAGAAGVHFEDQLSAAKKCGHLGGKVLVPTGEFIHKLCAARFAADILGVATIIIGRTDALSARLLQSDADPVDQEFIEGERTPEGFFRIKGGIAMAINRGLSYAPFADLIWFETSSPDVGEAREFAEAIHERFPGKMLAYNCSPSFNWKRSLDADAIAGFQEQLGSMGYKFQFVTLAGFHSLNAGMFDLATRYAQTGMLAYSNLQEQEFELERLHGFSAVKHQQFVGTGYFDEVQLAITNGLSSNTSLRDSTEVEQFH
jgi:isocitrate lyase